MLTTSNTLVLDHRGWPHDIITWQDAVTGLFDQNNAIYYVIAEYDEELRSPSITIKKPAVVGLVRKLDKFGWKLAFNRINMLLRDASHCQYCGQPFAPKELTYDHVFPKWRGGRRCYENIVMACGPCNHRKAGLTPEQAGMKLLSKPYLPRTLPVSAKSEHWIPREWTEVLRGSAA